MRDAFGGVLIGIIEVVQLPDELITSGSKQRGTLRR
jgi:hypothetical protein